METASKKAMREPMRQEGIPEMAKTSSATRSPAKKAAQRPMTPAAKSAPQPTAKKAAAKVAAKSATKAPAKSAAVTTVTMKHLAVSLAEQHDMSAKQSAAVLSDVFGGIVDRLKSGERVRIGGLGILEVKHRPARMGRNPATGEAIKIKASKKIAFRPAKDLKDAI
jgi:DNA-binding protein HU-beta